MTLNRDPLCIPQRAPAPVRILSMPLPEVVDLFKKLSAPDFREMHGEYKADLADHGGLFFNTLSESCMTSIACGAWLCKAFEPLGDEGGHGYNSFRKNGRVVRKFPMKTRIAPSRFDGRAVFQLDYTAYRSLLGRIHMVDEIRKVGDGLYLGVGTFGFTRRQRMRPFPFILSGPAEPFVGTDRPYAPRLD